MNYLSYSTTNLIFFYLVEICIMTSFVYWLYRIRYDKNKERRFNYFKSKSIDSYTPIIIGKCNDGINLLYDPTSRSALIVYNHDDNDSRQWVWAYSQVEGKLNSYDIHNLFFVSMTDEKIYMKKQETGNYVYLGECAKIMKGFDSECEEIVNVLFFINFEGIRACFENKFLYKNE